MFYRGRCFTEGGDVEGAIFPEGPIFLEGTNFFAEGGIIFYERAQ